MGSYAVVVGGEADAWQVYVQGPADSGKGSLEGFRAFVAGLVPGRDGIVLLGPASILSHYADIARLRGCPAVFCDEAPVGGFPASRFGKALSLSSRRDRARILARVSGTRLDDKGNARSGSVEVLDGSGDGAGWTPCPAGSRLCVGGGLRVEVLDTPRAGLHFRVGVAVAGSPVDAQGYRTVEPRFLASAKITRDGTYAVIPCDPIDPVREVADGSLGDPLDDALLLHALLATHGLDRAAASAFLRGEGPRRHGGTPYPRRAA